MWVISYEKFASKSLIRGNSSFSIALHKHKGYVLKRWIALAAKKHFQELDNIHPRIKYGLPKTILAANSLIVLSILVNTEHSAEAVEHRNGEYSIIRDAEDPQLGMYDKPLPCFGCGIGWFSLLLGFVFPLMWYYATILYFGNYYQKDPRERAGLAASAIAFLPLHSVSLPLLKVLHQTMDRDICRILIEFPSCSSKPVTGAKKKRERNKKIQEPQNH
ncbi:hypothetical protein CRYUN_Cryun34aG0064500 [Craigia yunnanensis]